MKLLFISATFPYPLNTGSRNLIYHWIEAAHRKHEVHVLIVGDPDYARNKIPGLPNLRIEIFPIVIGRRLSDRLKRIIASAVMGIPATSLACMPPAARRRATELVRTGGYDAVVLPENVVAGYAPILAPMVPVVLFKHSVHVTDARDERRRLGLYHPRWLLEEWIVRRFEPNTCRTATRVCCVNSEDAEELSRRYSLPVPAEVVPIGVDLPRFPNRGFDPGGPVIGFFGNMTWGANTDAVKWFVEAVLPKVWEKFPDALFRVIGPGGTQLRFGAADPRVVCEEGTLNIPEAMKNVVVGVVPVISGTGVRLKLLEMLSMGIPTVSTSLGRLGTNCVDGEHVLVADDPDAFAGAVSLLLSDSVLRQKLSRAGAKISRAHAWENSYPKILNLFELAVRRHSLRRACGPELREARSA